MTTRSLPIKYIPAEVKPSEWTELYERGFRYYRYDGFYNHDKVSGFEFVRGLPIDTLYTAGLANEDDEDQDLVTVLQSIYISCLSVRRNTTQHTHVRFESYEETICLYIHTCRNISGYEQDNYL